MIKYPAYSSDDSHKIEADYVIFRLAEIYYNLAEIKLKKGDKVAAEKLLNKVRAKNYPAGSKSLYPEDGSVISNQEMIDEWGREFIGEGLRRQILSRYGMYTKGTWWDKQPDADDHYQWSLLFVQPCKPIRIWYRIPVTQEFDCQSFLPLKEKVDTDRLGKTKLTNYPFENADGSKFVISKDYFGNECNIETLVVGPFENLPATKRLKILGK